MTTRRRRVLLLALGLAVVLVAAAAVVGLRWPRREVPVVVDPACPPLLRGTSNALDDYADLLTWAGQRYVAAQTVEGTPRADEVAVGAVVGTITCSLGSMPNEQGWSVAQGSWPDGTSTTLEKGTPLRTVLGRAGRALLAEAAEGDKLYCLADRTTLEPGC